MAMDNYTRRWKPQRLIDLNFSSIGDNWHKAGWEVATDAVEATTTDTILKATSHSAAVGDVVIMTNGDEDGEAREVTAIDANTITLASALSGTPSAAETFTIIRPVVLNKAIIIQLDSSLDQKVLIAESQSTPSNAHASIRSNADKSFDLKSNNLHMGANNAFDATDEYYLWVKTDSAAPTSGELDITVIE